MQLLLVQLRMAIVLALLSLVLDSFAIALGCSVSTL